VKNFKKLCARFWLIAHPYFFSEEKWQARGIFLVVIVFTLGINVVNVVQSFVLRDLMNAVADKKIPEFYNSGLLLLAVFAVFTPILTLFIYTQNLLQLHWRRWLTNRFLKRYFSNQAFYKIKLGDQIDNPDQRIAEDVNIFIRQNIDISGLLLNQVVTIISFIGILFFIDKSLSLVAIILALFRTTIIIFTGKKLSSLKFKQLQKEANFRYSLVHIRDNSESIAFYQGEKRELGAVRQRFSEVLDNFKRTIDLQRNLMFFTQGTQMIFSNLPIFFLAPRYFAGQIDFGQISQASGAFVSILGALGLIVDNFELLSNFTAEINRLGTFEVVLSKQKTVPQLGVSTIDTQEDNFLALQKVTLETPNHERTLVKDLSIKVEDGAGILVVGSSGVGKSSLMRAIAGLWNSGTGCIVRPNSEKMLFLPQRPYMVLGNLRSQLLYPNINGELSDEQLCEVLERVNLADLPNRVGGLDVELEWADVLSLGEQQRLAFARLLLAKPLYAILDESTSALDVANEKQLYQLLKQVGTTFISVGHRPTLVPYHDYVLKLGSNANWQIIPVENYSSDSGDLVGKA
jgi:putative ATP-binding cassette transporter